MVLSDNDIIEIVIDYVDDKRYNQAVLIDGDWGSGKTYFVQEKLIPALKAHSEESAELKQKIIYISLYGMDSCQQITNELYSSILEGFVCQKLGMDNEGKVGKYLNILAKLVTTGEKFFNIDTNELPKISDFKDINNLILITDDLERCNIDINQTFGFLNNLVEHNNIKVIIVANQSEIGQLLLTNDLPQKYSIILNENLKLNKTQEGKISANDLKIYAQELFSNDTVYEKIKEKLIGTTIYYKANLWEIYDIMIDKYIKVKLIKEYLLTRKSEVINLFDELKHSNLRTLIFSLTSFEKIAEIIYTISGLQEKYIIYELNRVLKYLIVSSINLKEGNTAFDWSGTDSQYGDIYCKYGINNNIFGYKFVDLYLQTRIIMKQEVIKVIEQIIDERNKEEAERAKNSSLKLFELDNWWELEDEQIQYVMNEILNELEQNKYHYKYFKDIIVKIMLLKQYGFSIECNNYIDIMQKYIEGYNGIIEIRMFNLLTDNEKFKENYTLSIEPLISIATTKCINLSYNNMNSCFLKPKWGEEFHEYCTKNKSDFEQNKKFLFYIDNKRFFSCLESSSVKEIYSFLYGINEVYSFSNLDDFYKSDLHNLEELISFIDIERLSKDKNTRRICLSKLKNKLEQSLELIKGKTP